MSDPHAIATDALFQIARRFRPKHFSHPPNCLCSSHVARRALFQIYRLKLSAIEPTIGEYFDSHSPHCNYINYDLWLLDPENPENPVRPNCNCRDH